MPETREFDLPDILSVTTSRLLSRRHIDGVHAILDYLTGDRLFTHQIPRAVEACAPALISQHPQLADIAPPLDIAPENIEAWLTETENTYGRSLPVAPITGWVPCDPFIELAAMRARTGYAPGDTTN